MRSMANYKEMNGSSPNGAYTPSSCSSPKIWTGHLKVPSSGCPHVQDVSKSTRTGRPVGAGLHDSVHRCAVHPPRTILLGISGIS
jgi:hypothetical protein